MRWRNQSLQNLLYLKPFLLCMHTPPSIKKIGKLQLMGSLKQGDCKLKACLGYREFKASLCNLLRPCPQMKDKNQPGDRAQW